MREGIAISLWHMRKQSLYFFDVYFGVYTFKANIGATSDQEMVVFEAAVWGWVSYDQKSTHPLP